MLDKLIVQIERYTQLNEQEIAVLQDNMHLKIYEKNELILKEGELSNKIYFVIQGCVRLFYNVRGNEKTAFFFTEGKFICAGEAYTYNIPVKENYQALEKTQLIYFTKENIDRLLKISPKFELIARIATEDELITCQRMIASFVTKSAEERYIELLETNGGLFRRFPQQYIASFLGVSPETLSRIKKRIAQNSKPGTS